MSQLERIIKKSTLKYALVAFGFCVLSEIISTKAIANNAFGVAMYIDLIR